jgi:hypothetical protein
MTITRGLKLACCAVALLLTTNAASASEASHVAERGGFLLGHAYRCGIASERRQPAARMMEQLIAALSLDGDEKIAADQKFIDQVLAGALPEASGDPLPSCAAIRRDLALFEQHQRLVSNKGEAAMSGETRSPKPEPQNRSVKPVRSKKPSTQPEGLSSEGRAKIALELAAQEQRRRPPSI